MWVRAPVCSPESPVGIVAESCGLPRPFLCVPSCAPGAGQVGSEQKLWRWLSVVAVQPGCGNGPLLFSCHRFHPLKPQTEAARVGFWCFQGITIWFCSPWLPWCNPPIVFYLLKPGVLSDGGCLMQ